MFERLELAETAAGLLTSSTIQRFIRIATDCARRSGVAKQLRSDPEFVHEWIRHARQLWASLRQENVRGPVEAELSLFLCVLSGAADAGVDELLADVGQIDSPSTAWVAPLARYLRSSR